VLTFDGESHLIEMCTNQSKSNSRMDFRSTKTKPVLALGQRESYFEGCMQNYKEILFSCA